MIESIIVYDLFFSSLVFLFVRCEVDVVELYCKDLVDLLAPKSVTSGSGNGKRGGVTKVAVRHRDDGAVYIESLTKVEATSADELNAVIARGLNGRHTRARIAYARASPSSSPATLRTAPASSLRGRCSSCCKSSP